MFNITDSLEKLHKEIWIVFMALLGGIVRVVNRPKCECAGRPGVIASLVTSLFAGLVMIHVLEDFGVTHGFKGAIVGLSGWLSTEILEILKRLLFSLLRRAFKKIGGE